MLEKELRYRQTILPFSVKPFIFLHYAESHAGGGVYDYREIKMRLLRLKPHAYQRRPVLIALPDGCVRENIQIES